jgi:hypothetical protein
VWKLSRNDANVEGEEVMLRHGRESGRDLDEWGEVFHCSYRPTTCVLYVIRNYGKKNNLTTIKSSKGKNTSQGRIELGRK